MSDTLDDRIAAIRAGAEQEVVRLLTHEEDRLAALSRRLDAVSAALAAREDELRAIAAGLGAAMDGLNAELARLEALGPVPSAAGDPAAPAARDGGAQDLSAFRAAEGSSLAVRPAEGSGVPVRAAATAPDAASVAATVEGRIVDRPITDRLALEPAERAVSHLRGVRSSGTLRSPGTPDDDGDRGRVRQSEEVLDRARLTALDMAARGRSREEVEAHVRDGLGVEDPVTIIDYVFGASTPSSVVPGWPPRRRMRRSA
jgi:hypothetical protein